eukprot:CAMPEP_0174874254 /NCGR_PEP_ID=MMETSP1114-20130205/76362_1 /TAXON_ID=312471 /ORGANISM="Neobodo designis, Strain CCAP 1951/1" /LENGTH=34 /DNA_ID= /DNA_START= /DNA_END= /DNA_ORIENTATION=
MTDAWRRVLHSSELRYSLSSVFGTKSRTVPGASA